MDLAFNDIYNAKILFLAVNANLRWLNNVTSAPCFSLAGGLCKFYANAGKRPIQRQSLLVQYKQQANPLLSMHIHL
jgi:hypothetical protein